jgi:ubiquitin-protein ligase
MMTTATLKPLNPIQRRLATDFDKVRKLVEKSGGTLRFIETTGSPPRQYILEYICPGLVKDNQGNIHVRNSHRVKIDLPADYPFNRPTARLMTPIFNPHVFLTLTICLGNAWNPGETLDMLVILIGKIIQMDPLVLDPGSPANHEAMEWVRKHPDQVPIGRETFQRLESIPQKITWD